MSEEKTQPYQLHHGDAIQKMKLMPDQSVDCVLTDLPYGTTANKWDSVIPLDELWKEWKRVCKPGAPIILFTQQPFTTTVAASNLKNLRTEWIWEKPQGTGYLNANRYPMKSHENILVFCDKLPPYHPQRELGSKPYVANRKCDTSTNYNTHRSAQTLNTDGSRFPKTVLHYAPDRGFHPTQKPVALLEYLIKTYTNVGDTVLDCTMGSGSTIVAALQCGRIGLGIERDLDYFATATRRLDLTIQSSTSPTSSTESKDLIPA